MSRFLAVLVKEFRQIRRDPLSLGILIFVPVLLLALYGYVLSFDIRHIPVGIVDDDGTPQSRQLVDRLVHNEYFDQRLRLAGPSEADVRLARGSVRAVLRIPAGFAAALVRGEAAAVQALVDAADANTASVTIGYLEAMADRATAEIRAQAGAAFRAPPVVLEPRIWFNPSLESSRFLVPGLMGMLLMLSAVIATSLSIVREKERRTIEQLAVSPIGPETLLLGKILPYLGIGLLTSALVLGAARLLFGVTVTGSYGLLLLTTLVFLFSALGMGLLISAGTDSQAVAFQAAVITSLLPSILLSGMIFPIENMAAPVRWLSALVPPRYFVAALRGVILKGATLPVVAPQLAAMAGLGLMFHLLAARKLRRLL